MVAVTQGPCGMVEEAPSAAAPDGGTEQPGCRWEENTQPVAVMRRQYRLLLLVAARGVAGAARGGAKTVGYSCGGAKTVRENGRKGKRDICEVRAMSGLNLKTLTTKAQLRKPFFFFFVLTIFMQVLF